jgi:phosphoesterase RecJ-like protein
MFEQLKSFIDRHDRFVVTTHVNPDCDALGSALGMASILQALGKSVRIINSDPTPERFRFVDPFHKVLAFDETIRPEQGEAVVVVDVGDLRRLGNVGQFLADHPLPFACIDHHKSNTGFAEVNVLDASACATALILYRIAREWGVPVGPDLASALYIAIYTDTGGFRFSNTDGETLHVAAALVEAGADPSYLATEFHENIPLGRARLFGKILSELRTDMDGKIVWILVTLEEMVRHGCDRSDIEGFVEYIRGLNTAEVAVLFRESEPGKTKLSFRSKDYVDCSLLASQFQGGGHMHAAGAMIDQDVHKAPESVLPVVREMVQNGEL